MIKQTKTKCWEIIQCGRHPSCFLKKDNQKKCWEHVESDADYLFHICRDCLVYVANQKDSVLGNEEFGTIMAQRKKNGIHKKGCSLDHMFR